MPDLVYLFQAARAPRPGESPRVHVLVDGALPCGTDPGAQLPEGLVDDVTCWTCRRELHRSGSLPYVRPPRATR